MEPGSGLDLATTFQPIVNNVMADIGELLPVVLVVFGALIAIRVGLRIFRMVTGR